MKKRKLKSAVSLLLLSTMFVPFIACKNDNDVPPNNDGDAIQNVEDNNYESVSDEVVNDGYEIIEDEIIHEAKVTPLSGKCGENITFTIDEDGTLTLSGSGNTRYFRREDYIVDTPWFEQRKDVKKIVVEDGATVPSNAEVDATKADNLGTVSDSGEHGDNIKWEYYADTNTLVVSGKGEIAYADEYPWDKYSHEIKNIYVKKGITKISRSCFSANMFNGDYAYLETVSLPDTLLEIDDSAFSGAVRLKNVTVPSGVTAIGKYAFEECYNLSNVMLPKTLLEVGKDAFNNCRYLHVFYEGSNERFYSNIKRNGGLNLDDFRAHFNSDGIEIKKIEGKTAFAPEGDIGEVTESGKCNDEIIDDLTWEFYEASGILVIKGTGYMPAYDTNSRQYNGEQPWGTQKKKEMTTGRITITKEALPYTELYITDGVVSVGEEAFRSSEQLKSVKISGSVEYIEKKAFEFCEGLEEIVISKGVRRIFDDAIPSNATVKFTGSEQEWNDIYGSSEVNAKEIIFNYEP